MSYYADSLQHILDELARIDLIVRAKVEEWRKHNKNPDFLGLYISEEDVDLLLMDSSNSDLSLAETKKIEALRKEIDEKKKESVRRGVELRLETLAELFNLSPLEIDAVLICLAPELDLKYGKLYSYLQDDVTKKRPTVDLILEFTCKSREDKIAARRYFRCCSPLIKNLILHLEGDNIPLLEKAVRLDDRILNFLLGSNELDPNVASFASLIKPETNFDELTQNIKNQLVKLSGLDLDLEPLFLFYGNSSEMRGAAEAFCSKAGVPLLIADLDEMDTENSEVNVKLLFREAKLQRAAIYLDKFDALDERAKKLILREVEEFEGAVFIPSEVSSLGKIKKKKVISIHFPNPSYAVRERIWRSFLGEFDGIEELAGKFRFGRNKIRAAIELAKSKAFLRNPKNPSLTLDDLYEGCRSLSSPIPFAIKVIPRYTWDDIVLPKDKKEQLREICNYVKYYAKVYEDWGFDRHSRGKGLNALFSGPSGTGKTMAAEIIANELKLDMYKIDLSMVVSKYVGETEKNLNRIFRAAEESNAVLFFDEADALFGKRSEIKDAHDRYANIEINYLLQKMEEHEGIVILATNLSKNIDEAFLRRMHFIVEFPFPDEEYRLEIWKKVFPKEAPLDSIDFEFLARLKLSGGNIKNVALTAAFFAAESSRITMEHVVKALKREFQKIGRAYGKAEFGKYYDLVK